VVLFVAACAWGVLEVHYSTDTWIGLAAGRQIVTEPTFPKADTFSYTSYGQTWFNQNWLSHVFFWLLYDKLGPDATVIGTWLVSASMFTLVLLATWLRCRSWLASLLAAAVVAIASRDWLSIRPATIQFFLLAAAWLAFSALIGQGQRRRWWPLLLLLATYAVWPHAHGSFILGFGLLGLFLGCAAAARLAGLKWRIARIITDGQALTIAAIGLLTAGLGAVLSPYGVENFTHPFKVVESQVFRTVGEWFPPYISGRFPGVLRFWIAVAIAGATPIVILLLRAVDVWRTPAPASKGEPLALHTILFDLASVAIGLYMAMFARRFAPLFYILAAPALVTWTLRLARPLSWRMQDYARETLLAGAWLGAATSLAYTARLAYQELFIDVIPDGHYNLLDRVTHNDHTPMAAIDFLRRNGLTPDVMTEWKVAAAVMFYVPGARVFIDGRAQQVYSEQQYATYMGLLSVSASEGPLATQVLDRYGTNLLLLPKWEATSRLMRAIENEPEWKVVMEEPVAAIWVRDGSKLCNDILERTRAGTLWWPDTPETQWRHGLLLAALRPDNLSAARALWQSAVAGHPSLGLRAYSPIVHAFLEDGQPDAATAYLQQERAKLESMRKALRDDLYAQLSEEIRQCEALVAGQPRGPGR
jgi:hypothetical protein